MVENCYEFRAAYSMPCSTCFMDENSNLGPHLPYDIHLWVSIIIIIIIRFLINVQGTCWDPNHLSDESPVEGPPIPITIDMVKKAISQMKAGKAPGQSGIVVEMIRAAGDMDTSMIRDLAAAIIHDGKVPSNWEFHCLSLQG